MPEGRSKSLAVHDGPTPMKVFDNEKLGSTSEAILPAPVQLSPGLTSRSRRQRQCRFVNDTTKGFVSTNFNRLRRKFEAGTAPDASSVDPESESVADANDLHGTWWGRGKMSMALEDAEEVDEIVVDRTWGDDFRSCSNSDPGGEKDGGGFAGGALATDGGSVAGLDDREASSPLIVSYLRWKVWPVMRGFFATQFVDRKSEDHYRKENWYVRKVRRRTKHHKLAVHNLATECCHLVCGFLRAELGRVCGVRAEADVASRQDISLRCKSRISQLRTLAVTVSLSRSHRSSHSRYLSWSSSTFHGIAGLFIRSGSRYRPGCGQSISSSLCTCVGTTASRSVCSPAGPKTF